MDSIETIEILAPAKINFGLRVLRKRIDGYHDIETVFLPLEWHDTITIGEADTIQLTCSDPGLPTDARNLCMKAAKLLADRLNVSKGAYIHLEKNLPHGAGLGGGSSDAAATLMGLCQLWALECPSELLFELALQLGSDVPYFLSPKPALGQGRGEILTGLDLQESNAFSSFPANIVVAVPPIHISSRSAYDDIVPGDDQTIDLQSLVASGSSDEWKNALRNDFETTIFERHPVLKDLKQFFYEVGAVYASMSGSGSSVYGLFEEADQAKGAIKRCAYPGWCGFVLVR